MRYPDTSFLCSIYREQTYSAVADVFMGSAADPLPVSALLLLEFRQSVRLQTFLHTSDKTRGYPHAEGERMLRDLQSDLAARIVVIQPVDWADVHQLAERLSATYAEKRGHRLADILHVATALHLGAAEFLTFDQNQRALAQSEGLTVLPRIKKP